MSNFKLVVTEMPETHWDDTKVFNDSIIGYYGYSEKWVSIDTRSGKIVDQNVVDFTHGGKNMYSHDLWSHCSDCGQITWDVCPECTAIAEEKEFVQNNMPKGMHYKTPKGVTVV